MNAGEIFWKLHSMDLIPDRFPYWWKNYGSWWILPEAILTQQAKWESVEKSVANLKMLGFDSLENLAKAEAWKVAQAITPAGFYNQKTTRILSLIGALIRDFGDFESFCEGVSREWLLAQKGIGFESADAILCYGCKREVFVVDNYTHKLLSALGFEMDDYHELQEWFVSGVESEADQIMDKLGLDLHASFAYLHGMIVEFSKTHKKGTDIAQILL